MSLAPNNTALERIRDTLFKEPEERAMLSPMEEAIRERYCAVLTQMIDHPMMPQTEMINYLVNTFGIKKSQAYVDLKACGALFGNFRMASEQWSKYLVIEINKAEIARCKRCIETIEKACTDEGGNIVLRAKDHSIINGYQKIILDATKIIGKYERLDKQEAERPNWDDVKPVEFDVTNDITVLPEFQDAKLLTPEEKKRIRDKYIKDIPEAEEVK